MKEGFAWSTAYIDGIFLRDFEGAFDLAERLFLAMNQSTGVDWEGQEKEGGRVTCPSQVSLFLFSTEVQGLTSKSYGHPFAQSSN